jgi:hypothetical protein
VGGAAAVDSNGGGADITISTENAGTIQGTSGIVVQNGSNITSLENAGSIIGNGGGSGIRMSGGDLNNLTNLSSDLMQGDYRKRCESWHRGLQRSQHW